jgi:putative ABC transport system permease protein
MLVARQTVQQKIDSVKSSIGNTISISPAGSQGFQGGGEPLTSTQLAQVAKVANVTHVTETLSDRLTTTNTNLVSAIDPGTLGNRRAGDSGVGFTAPPAGDTNRAFGGTNGASGTQQITRTFTPPVVITGTNDSTTPSVYGGSTVSFTSGQAIDPTKEVNEAMVGKSLATKNNLSVGSTFTAYGTTVKVVGIYDTGTTFSNAGLIVSLPTLQRLSSQAGDITSATVTTSSVDTIAAATANIKSILGDKADVTNDQDSATQAVAPLENVKSISLFSLIGALAAGSIIILLTMMMIVRERRREIGVMKAIGASNLKTTFQFISEAVTLTLLGMVVGIVIGIAAANPITKVLVNNSTSNATSTAQTAQGAPGAPESGGARRAARGIRSVGSQSLANVKNIQASVGWSILGYGFGAALVIAIIGSALPAFFISKIRPAEVMRAE